MHVNTTVNGDIFAGIQCESRRFADVTIIVANTYDDGTGGAFVNDNAPLFVRDPTTLFSCVNMGMEMALVSVRTNTHGVTPPQYGRWRSLHARRLMVTKLPHGSNFILSHFLLHHVFVIHTESRIHGHHCAHTFSS